jgi:hypothetical protein
MCIPYAVNVQVKTQMSDDAGKPIPSDRDRFVKMLIQGGARDILPWDTKTGKVTRQ